MEEEEKDKIVETITKYLDKHEVHPMDRVEIIGDLLLETHSLLEEMDLDYAEDIDDIDLEAQEPIKEPPDPAKSSGGKHV